LIGPRIVLVCVFAILLIACGDSDKDSSATSPREESTGLTSDSLEPDQPMPVLFTCDGEDRSPGFSWGEPPAGTQSLMLLMEDLDAPGGTFTHWLIYGLDVSVRSVQEGVEKLEQPANAPGIQIENDFGEIGYAGPCPPAGNPHRYEFRLVYLDSPIEVKPGAIREDVDAAAAGHPIGGSSFIVTYQR
jgi:Raf kinase inhibitor-like YbhB/YbcL family protein